MNGAMALDWWTLVQAVAMRDAVPVPWPAVAALIMTLVINTAALFFWGGKTAQMLRDHDRRLQMLEGVMPAVERRIRAHRTSDP